MSTSDKAKWNLFSNNLTTQIGGNVDCLSSSLLLVDNEPGSGEVKLALDDTLVSSMTPGTLLKCSYRGSVRGGFFVENIHQVDADQNENSGRIYSVNGRGLLSVLDTFHVLNDISDSSASVRTFADMTKAEIIIQLITEAQAAGALLTVTYDFSATLDSSSIAWTDNENINIPVGKKILDVVREFSKSGEFNVRMNISGSNLLLSAYKAQVGSDVSSTIYFRIGSNCEEVSRDLRAGKELVNQYLYKYKTGYGVVSDDASIAANGLNADFLNLDKAQSEESARTFAAAKLDLDKDPKESKSVKVYDGTSPNVFLDYDLGYAVSLDRFGTITSDRILSMQLDFSKEDFASVFIDFNYIFLDSDIRTQQALDDLLDQWSTAYDANLLEVRQPLNIGLPNGNVNASFIYNNELYVFGNFTNIGNIAATRAAKYNLSTGVWSALSTGISAEVLYAVRIGTTIYATTLTTVNKYASGSWSTVGTLTSGEIRSLATDGTNLFVGGSFLAADGLSSDKIAKWNGSAWSNSHAASYDCESLCYFDGFLYSSQFTGSGIDNLRYYAGGAWNIFVTTNNVCGGVGTDDNWIYWVLSTNHVVRWNSEMGSVYNYEDLGDLGFAPVASIISGTVPTPYAAYLTDVYIGRVGVATYPNGIVKYSGALLSNLGNGAITSGNIRTISVNSDNGDVYIGGSYLGFDSKPINYLNVYVTDFQSLLDHSTVDNNNTLDLGSIINNAPLNAVAAGDKFVFYDVSTGAISAISNKTGLGKMVFDTSPTLVTPVLGVATVTSVNKVAITAPATSATLTIADGKTFTVNQTLTITGTSGTTFTFPATTGTVATLNTSNVFTANQKIATAANATLTLDRSDSGTDYFEIKDSSNLVVGIKKVSSSGGATIDIDPAPADGAGDSAFRFFRNTNTSGDVYFAIFQGDGTATQNGQISANANRNSYLSLTNNFGVGTSSPSTKFHAVNTTTTTNAILEVARIEARVSTAATGSAAGFGASLTWYAETATDGTNQLLGSITGEWATATNASRKALMKFNVYDTAVREAFRIEASGTVAQISFFGGATAPKGGTFTQTYSTATLTHANQTAVDPATYGAGTNGYSTAAMAQAIHAEVIAHKVDIANVKQVVNQLIDILQAFNLVG